MSAHDGVLLSALGIVGLSNSHDRMRRGIISNRPLHRDALGELPAACRWKEETVRLFSVFVQHHRVGSEQGFGGTRDLLPQLWRIADEPRELLGDAAKALEVFQAFGMIDERVDAELLDRRSHSLR